MRSAKPSPWAFFRTTTLAPTLNLVITSGHAKILSAPDLVTLPGHKADFLVGGQIPIPVSTGPQQIAIDYKEYGVKLEITPTILGNGDIETLIAPEVSDLDFSDGVTLNGFVVPALKTSKLSTDVITRDGESIVMGGLLSRVEQRTINEDPDSRRSPDPRPAFPLDQLSDREDRRRVRHDADHSNALTPGRGSARGQLLPVFALMLVVLIGMAAMAVDVGYWRYQQRLAQTAADAAAIAGADELKYPALADWNTAAKNDAAANGFTDNGGVTVGVTASSPPLTGSYIGNVLAVQVTVSQKVSAILRRSIRPCTAMDQRDRRCTTVLPPNVRVRVERRCDGDPSQRCDAHDRDDVRLLVQRRFRRTGIDGHGRPHRLRHRPVRLQRPKLSASATDADRTQTPIRARRSRVART